MAAWYAWYASIAGEDVARSDDAPPAPEVVVAGYPARSTRCSYLPAEINTPMELLAGLESSSLEWSEPERSIRPIAFTVLRVPSATFSSYPHTPHSNGSPHRAP